jgi:hypothetical protein
MPITKQIQTQDICPFPLPLLSWPHKKVYCSHTHMHIYIEVYKRMHAFYTHTYIYTYTKNIKQYTHIYK